MSSVVLTEGVRTPMAEYNGALAGVGAIELGILASKEALARARFEPDEIDHVIFGNVM